MKKTIIAYINAENVTASNIIRLAKGYYENGADSLYIYNYTRDEKSKEEFLMTARAISKEVELPFVIGTYVKRFEDIKKAFYTGARQVVLSIADGATVALIEEGVARFGKDKIIAELDYTTGQFHEGFLNEMKELGVAAIILKHVELNAEVKNKVKASVLPIYIRDSLIRHDIVSIITMENLSGIATNYYADKNIQQVKQTLKEQEIEVDVIESFQPFSSFKLNSDGLIPVVTQDFQTGEVLMLAYMNEEAYNLTIQTGKMTYWSRSRQELWCKGETSGHVQYVKALKIDCDSDTILAKVHQLGAACHTGNHTCFFADLIQEKQYDAPYRVLNEVYDIIMDRKTHPREGSYTNYLFDQGIDKILKKCGEEATEIVIAAKNPNAEELKYEIADYMYHLMVLMAECNLDWEDVARELSHRK